MREVYGDLHIHIGSARGRAVKITASRKLDLKTIIYRDAPRKGLDMVGVVDAACLPVCEEIEEMLSNGELQEQSRGGFLARNDVLLIAACEVESLEGMHSIIYLPYMESIKKYQKYVRSRVSNMSLSTQKINAGIKELIDMCCLLDGIFCPAHAFTPHKGIYGMWTNSLSAKLGRDVDQIKALELGLSADTEMAGMLAETRKFTFLSNSDAHSSPNVGREYNLFRMAGKNFQELRFCLENNEGRRVLANYGMDPLMGKYYRSYCPECKTIRMEKPPVFVCNNCGQGKIINGVYDRIVSIRDYENAHQPLGRPPYHYRVPLKELPGLGPRTIEKLLTHFPNEIDLVERASIDDVERFAGESIALMIKKMRVGRLSIRPGGGGNYGKVIKPD